MTVVAAAAVTVVIVLAFGGGVPMARRSGCSFCVDGGRLDVVPVTVLGVGVRAPVGCSHVQ